MDPTNPTQPTPPDAGGATAPPAGAAAEAPSSASSVSGAASPGSGSSAERPGVGPAARLRGTKRLKRKRWKRRLLALSFGTLLCLALTECGVRLVWTRIVSPWEAPLVAGSSASLGRALIEESLRGPGDGLRENHDDLYRWDPLENLRLRENVVIEARSLQGTPRTFRVTTDENGLRGPITPLAPGALKVLCIGDSMTFGQGVNDKESYPAQLEGKLQEALARPVRIYNAGVISLGQREQINVTKRLIPILQPDLVLIQFTVANDVMDDQRWFKEPGPEGELKRRLNACNNLEHHLALTNPLARWSRAYRLGVWRWGRHVIRYRYMIEEENVALAAAQLLELRDACRDPQGALIPAAVLIAPSVLQVEGGFAEVLLRTERINRSVRAHMQDAKVKTFDVLEPLRAARAAGQDLFIPVDRHWTAAGNRVVAEEAARVCQELLQDAAK